MAVTTAIAIYFIMWWVVLFAVLPWGVRGQHEGGEIVPGSDPGAPALPQMALKLAATTIVSGALFGVVYYVYVNRLVTLDQLGRLMGMPD
jgi:predicted secreted protein